MITTGGANTLTLPHNTSLLVFPDSANLPSDPVRPDELWVMALLLALCRVASRYFKLSPMNAGLALRLADLVESD